MDELLVSIDDILCRYTTDRANLVPILHDVQQKHGYLSTDALGQVADFLKLNQSVIYGVATFYGRFKFQPSGKHCIRVCRGTACHVKGAGEVLNELEKRLGIKAGQTTWNGEYSLETEACFGSCALAPVVVKDDQVHGRMTPAKVGDLLRSEP